MGKIFNNLMMLTTTSMAFTTNLMANAANLPPMDATPVFVPLPATSCSNCASLDTRQNIRSGLYGGVQAGYEHMRISYENTFTAAPGNNQVVSQSAFTNSKGGFVGDAVIGGRMVYSNCFVAGLEASASFSGLKNTRNHTLGGVNLQYKTYRNVSFVPSIVLGWLINDRFMVYEKTGLVVAQLRSDVTNANSLPMQRRKKGVLGVAPVIGVEFGVNKMLSMRTEVGVELFGNKTQLYTFNPDTLGIKRKFSVFNVKFGVIAKL